MSIYDSLTRDWLTSTFLLGVDLTLDDGSSFPDVVFDQAIRGAVSLSALSKVHHEGFSD